MKRFALLLVLVGSGCATVTVAHPAPRTQAVAKCLAAEQAGVSAPACAPLAKEVAALRAISLAAEAR